MNSAHTPTPTLFDKLRRKLRRLTLPPEFRDLLRKLDTLDTAEPPGPGRDALVNVATDKDATVLDITLACLCAAAFQPELYTFDGTEQGILVHRTGEAPAVIYSAVGQPMEGPTYQGLHASRFEPGTDPTDDDDCMHASAYTVWEGPQPTTRSEMLRDIAGAVNAIIDDADQPWA
ncbi:hypothetical protein ABZ234_08040 [Nocardiopsis sp. NPDC006198]|uniref:hypothetical protein n=1 Tax=Nocardiopsis sp. NPDC006198 TaxID=3154472 RepID=UPI0033A4A5B3